MWLVALLAVARPQQQAPVDLATELAHVVDVPSAAARRQAAADLARRYSNRLEDLLAAARAFGSFEMLAPGTTTQRVPLVVGPKTEDTELVLVVPDGYDPATPTPLLLAFHGTGGEGGGMASMWSGIARDAGIVVLAPSEAGPNDGYHFSERERLAALAALRWVRRKVNVDENKIFATGVSRGGHLTWDLALRYPDLFAGIAPMIGSPRITIAGGQNNLRYVENVAQTPIRDLQGAKDDPQLVASVQLAFEKLRGLAALDAQLFLQPEHGHSFDLKAVDWKAFFASAKREPHPEHVVRASARADEGRVFWAEVTAYSPLVDETFVPEVSEMKWAGMSEDERRRYLVAQCEQRTSRIQMERTAVGRFSGRSTGVKRFRLLLASGDFDPKVDVEVGWNNDVTKKRLRGATSVLMQEFAERFDRTFLPVAELEIH